MKTFIFGEFKFSCKYCKWYFLYPKNNSSIPLPSRMTLMPNFLDNSYRIEYPTTATPPKGCS